MHRLFKEVNFYFLITYKLSLGNVLIKLGRHEESEASYLHAIELEPSSAQGHYHLGLALTEMGRFSEAETSYRKAISLQPDHAEAHRNLAAITKYGSHDDHFRQMQKIYKILSEELKTYIHSLQILIS